MGDWISTKWNEGIDSTKEWWNGGALFPNFSDGVSSWVSTKWNEGIEKFKTWWDEGGFFPEGWFGNLLNTLNPFKKDQKIIDKDG